MNIEKEVAAMKRMTVDQLRIKYGDVFGEHTNGRNKDWLVKRIAWRMQANEEGDLSERARKRAMEIANDADIRTTPPRQPKPSSGAQERTIIKRQVKIQHSNELLPGTKLKRAYKGETVSVTVLTSGFEYQGERFKSLTSVAKAITGKHWNGFHFFGLRNPRGAK
jgi:hypothetical protein